MERMFYAVIPMLFILISYIDPGKWIVIVEGGARFGSDFIILLLFNLVNVFCQYLSASIAVVTGKNLAQICITEYDKVTCAFLGIQVELSMLASDLSMILGLAHGLNLLFGLDLLTCVLLTSVDAVLFRVFSNFLDASKARLLCIWLASFILVSCLLGVIICQPETPLSVGGLLPKLGGESAFALLSLLGASIIPHNFYLHCSIVQVYRQYQGPTEFSIGTLRHDHFIAVLCFFSGIFLVNYMLMNMAANVFYSTGLDLLTFQDAFSLMDQVLRSRFTSFLLVIVLMLSDQMTALTWKFAGQTVLYNFFKLSIPSWLHHATVRVVAIIPAVYCVWTFGAEGAYQLMIFSQVVVALWLPSAVIPLYRVALSDDVMGEQKASSSMEFLMLISFIGMLGLEIIFVIELIFGNSDWATNLRWNTGGSTSISFIFIIILAFISFWLTLWLAATPLRSTGRSDALPWNVGTQAPFPASYLETEEINLRETRFRADNFQRKQEPTSALESENHQDLSITTRYLNSSNMRLDSDIGSHLTAMEETYSDFTFAKPPRESSTTLEMSLSSVVPLKISDDINTLNIVPAVANEKTSGVNADSNTMKYNEEDILEIEETSQVISGSSPSLTSEGSGSLRSLIPKNDDVGSGAGSLSRLAGLGRAARRQLASVLDEFWGQLFDFHGQATNELIMRNLIELLSVDSKVGPKTTAATLKLDSGVGGFISSVGGRGSDSLINPSLYAFPVQRSMQTSLESSYGAQRGSPVSTHSQLLDTYNAPDASERRYSSLRLTPASGALYLPQASRGNNDQPATIHGYQIKSLINQMSKERSMEMLAPQLASPKYKSPPANLLGQNPRNGSTPAKPPGFPDPVASRNVPLQSQRTFSYRGSPGPAESMPDTVNEKKFHSMPDISGLALAHRESLLCNKSPRWDNPPATYGTLGHKMSEQPLYPGSFGAGTPMGLDDFSLNASGDVSPSRLNSGSDAWSMWSPQPFEQFGAAGQVRNAAGEGLESKPNLITQGTAFSVDFEGRLLQSIRHCIAKLLKLESSDWLFKQNGGLDEDLIDRVAARERFLLEAESKETNPVRAGESHYSSSQRLGTGPKLDEAEYTKYLVTSVPNCGEDCIWRVDLLISFGVWSIHRVLELSLMESRPELWGKYTYVLNRLQGIIDLAFSKPRSPLNPCFCLQLPSSHQQESSPPRVTNGSLPPPAKHGKGKVTTASTLLDIVKDVEIAISCRKGRTGTTAGDVAFPKGKENLASVLKRYKRRLSNILSANTDVISGAQKVQVSTP